MTQSPATQRRRLTIERAFRASLDEVWALWTTPAGIESWWGPEGFQVAVRSMDLNPGGALVYVMTATAPDQVAFMKQAGMPLSTEARVTYTEVTPPRRLGYTTLADFVPGVAPYDVATLVELHADGDTVRMVLIFDAMHDEIWTERARMGHEGQLGKLEAVLAGRAG
jgi:uncharacterized protein YndB with AHSA1/START domain